MQAKRYRYVTVLYLFCYFLPFPAKGENQHSVVTHIPNIDALLPGLLRIFLKKILEKRAFNP
jgi:hypothetical protein